MRRELKIAEATTKIHMAALLRVLGVRNRTEAAVRAQMLMGRADPRQDTAPDRSERAQFRAQFGAGRTEGGGSA